MCVSSKIFDVNFMYCIHIFLSRRFSGANVQIEEAKGNGRRCNVSLSGTPEAVSAANFLINARWVTVVFVLQYELLPLFSFNPLWKALKDIPIYHLDSSCRRHGELHWSPLMLETSGQSVRKFIIYINLLPGKNSRLFAVHNFHLRCSKSNFSENRGIKLRVWDLLGFLAKSTHHRDSSIENIWITISCCQFCGRDCFRNSSRWNFLRINIRKSAENSGALLSCRSVCNAAFRTWIC